MHGDVGQMVTIKVSQRVWEIHEYTLTEEQYKEYRKTKGNDRLMFLDDVGGSEAEYVGDAVFKFEVIK